MCAKVLSPEAKVCNSDDRNASFYVHRTAFFTCSPAAFSHEVCSTPSTSDESHFAKPKTSRRSACTQSCSPIPCKNMSGSWEPSEEEPILMCNAFSVMTTARWEVLIKTTESKPRWSNKCLQTCVLNLCVGRLQKHAKRVFNQRCFNDVVSGYGSFLSMEKLLAVAEFLRMHNLRLSILEEEDDGRCEEFILGSGSQCLGHLFLDARKGHASLVPRNVHPQCFTTEVSLQPWTRSAVGADFLSSNLPSNMKLFRQRNAPPNVEPNGYILTDSFHYFKKQNKKTVYYLPELLAELYACTGHVVYALCSGGAAFAHRSNGAALYSEMLNRTPCNLDFIMLLSFGNDWYGQSRSPVYHSPHASQQNRCVYACQRWPNVSSP